MAQCTCADPQAVAQAVQKVESAISTADENHVNAMVGSPSLDETLYGKETVDEDGGKGQHGSLDRLRFCHWAAPEWGPTGENAWVTAFQAAQVAIALTNAIIQGQIADMNQDLAEKYYDMAEFKWNRFAGNYMPLEKEILWEAQSTPIRELNCADDRERAEEAVNLSFDAADPYLARLAKSYRLCLDPTVIDQMNYSRTRLAVDTINYNMLDDQWFTDYKNDQRWARRSNILNLGRNLGSVAMQYGDVARKTMAQVGDLVNKAAGSLSQALGYYGTRNDTYYPTTYLAGQTHSVISMATTSVQDAFGAVSGSQW